MTWDQHIAAARAEQTRRAAAEQKAIQADNQRTADRDAALAEIAAEVERVLVAFDAADWRGATRYRPRFEGYLKLRRQIRGQAAINVKIHEVVIAHDREGSSGAVYAGIEFYQYAEDGKRARIWTGPPEIGDPLRSGSVEFCGPQRLLKPAHILPAVARWSVAHGVTLDL